MSKMKKIVALLLVIVLFYALPFEGGFAQTVSLTDFPSLFNWPCANLYSEVYTSVNGNSFEYQFTQTPDKKVALRYWDTRYTATKGQYVLQNEVFVNNDGSADLITIDGDTIGQIYTDGSFYFNGNTFMRFPGGFYWPAWLYESKNNERSEVGDVKGNVVQALITEDGCFRIGDGSMTRTEDFYFVPNDGAAIKYASEEKPSGFCVSDGWIYLSEGRIDSSMNFVPYENNNLFQWDNTLIRLLGMTDTQLVFVDKYHGDVIVTDKNGANGRYLFQLSGDDGKFTYVSMNRDTVCCTYTRKLNGNAIKEHAFVLIDIASGNSMFFNTDGCYTEESLITSNHYYAIWAAISENHVLFYNIGDNKNLQVYDLSTGWTTNLFDAEEVQLSNALFYEKEPICTVVDGWLYHVYQYDQKMLLRSKLDGSIPLEYVTTLENEILDLEFAKNQLAIKVDIAQGDEYLAIPVQVSAEASSQTDSEWIADNNSETNDPVFIEETMESGFRPSNYVVAGGGAHVVGLKSDGTVVAVGNNECGQCNVSDWTDIVQVSAGDYHTVGLRSDGTVVAIGGNFYGECNVSGWTDIVQVSTGDYHTVGLRSDGTVVAIGYNPDGECNVSGWTDIVQVSAGLLHTVGLKSDGTVLAVGANCAGLEVSDWTDIVQVAAGTDFTVGLKKDGTVISALWSVQGVSELTSWTDIIQIDCGTHVVGLKADGTVVCNLSGYYDDLFTGIEDWTDIIQVSAGLLHTVGLKSDGTVVISAAEYTDWYYSEMSSWRLKTE